MARWWEEWPGRLEAELGAFRDHGLTFERDEAEFAGGRVVLHGTLPTETDGPVRLVVAYPDSYPHTRFTVFAPDLSLPRHQHPFGRNLCLLPRGSDHWRPGLLAANVVAESVPTLLATLRAGSVAMRAAEDPQGEPFSYYYGYWPHAAVLVPSEALSLATSVRSGRLTVRLRGDDRWMYPLLRDTSTDAFGQCLLATVENETGSVLATAEPALSSTFTGREISGRWIRVREPIVGGGNADYAKALWKVAPEMRPTSFRFDAGGGHFALVGVVYPEEVRQGEFEDAWVLLLVAKRSRSDSELRVGLLRGVRVTMQDSGARIPELRPLQSRTASIVGLGSLGSPIARELARAMVGRLRLLDHDYVDAGSGARWLLGVDAAGLPKVQQLEAHFRRSYPYTAVETADAYIGLADIAAPSIAPSESAVIGRWLEGTHIVIDATAEDNVSRLVASLAQHHKVPQVFVWSIDGYGGVVARVIPGRTGCYHCLSMALDPDVGSIASPSAPTSSVRTRLQPRGCADPTFTAAAPDLEPLSLHAARVVFGLLCEGSPGAYPSFPHDVFVLTHRNPDGSLLSPPRWDAYPLPVNPGCPLCNPPTAP